MEGDPSAHYRSVRMTNLGEDEDGSADLGPVEEPVGFVGFHIDTAMGHGSAEIAVPVGAMEAVALVKIHDPGDIFQVVTRAGHIVQLQLGLYTEIRLNRWVISHARGDEKGLDD